MADAGAIRLAQVAGEPGGDLVAVVSDDEGGDEQHLPGRQRERRGVLDRPRDDGALGGDLVEQPERPGAGQEAPRLALGEEEQRERRGDQQERVEGQDVGAVPGEAQQHDRGDQARPAFDLGEQRAIDPDGEPRADRQDDEDQRQRGGQGVEGPGPRQRRPHSALEAVSCDPPPRDDPEDQPGEEDEPLGGGDRAGVAAGQRIEPGGAADVVDDHREDAEAAQQVQARVAADRGRHEAHRGEEPFERLQRRPGAPGLLWERCDGHSPSSWGGSHRLLTTEYEGNAKKLQRSMGKTLRTRSGLIAISQRRA